MIVRAAENMQQFERERFNLAGVSGGGCGGAGGFPWFHNKVSVVVKHIVILVSLFAFSLPAEAAGRGGLFRAFSSRSTKHEQPAPHAASRYRHLLASPEKMTAVFGPSILVRQPARKPAQASAQVSRFVTQPAD